MATALVNQKAQGKSQLSMARPLSLMEEMDQLMRRIEERAYGLFQERGGGDGFALSDWFRAEHELVKSMPIQVEETDSEVIVQAEVPGFEAKELKIRAESDLISVYGKTEKKTETEKGAKRHYSEIASNEVYREIYLPTSVDPEKATAHLEKGVLKIHMRKAASPRVVEIKAA
jgi:HSP20 family protein